MPLLEYIRNNFVLKVFSLALAVLIWMAVRSHIDPDFELPLNFFRSVQTEEYTLPVKLLISAGPNQGFKVSPPAVKVVVSGEALAIRRLQESAIQVFARLDDARGPTMSDFQLDVKVPRDITVEKITPERVAIEATGQGSSFMLFPWAPTN